MVPQIDHVIAAGVKPAVAQDWLPFIQATCAEFQINTPKRVAAFIAQTAHESGGYTMLTENLNYSADTLAGVWPNRFAVQEPDPAKKGKTRPKKEKGKNIPNKFAQSLHRKPEMIANVCYSARMGNGTIESGEGWLYRGRGAKQLTGKDNYTRCGKALGIDLVANPDLLLQPEFAMRSAGWFWASNKCAELIDKDDFVGLTKRINGGVIGLSQREAKYKAILAKLG